MGAVGTIPSARAVMNACDGPVGAYVHVPFCSSLCPFCPYNKVRARDDLAQHYFATLDDEISWYVDALHRSNRQAFTSLYIGGGTPTLYPAALAHVIASVPVTGEVAVEVLPLHGTGARLDELQSAGVSAVSIGAQSFHDPVLRALHRPHDAAASRSAVQNALERFDTVDVDLIMDVAWEADPDLRGAFLRDVADCFEMGVEQVSTYPLMRFGYTPFGRARHDRRHEHALLHEVSTLADSAGYERRSVWTFNRADAASYTSITRRRFIGMGAGGASFTGRDFYVNHFSLDAYSRDVAADRLPVARWLHLGRAAGWAYDVFWQAYAGDVAGHRMGARGFDVYHDLERLVTYQLIEPLWAQMLAENDDADWATPEQARGGRLWSVVSALLERTTRPAAPVVGWVA
jgi:coproporphyrinogen III oxidase-like Fe-S oxidoreductase